MKPEDVLRVIAAARGSAICIPTMTAAPGWRDVAPDDLSVSCVGFMGGASTLGLGLALGCPDRRVIVLDGDGSLCMQLGSLPTIAGVAPRNLAHLLFKNNVYHTSGSQGTPGGEGVDYVMMARGAGYRDAFAVRTLAELERRLPAILTGEGPLFVELHTGLAEKTPMTDRGGLPFHQQVEKLGDFTRPGRLADLQLMRHLRACADAVSVGAQTLRDHPDFIGTHEDIGDGLGEALSRFRASQGRRRLPLQVVYSGSGRLDLDAPIFTTPDLAVIIVTTDPGARLLRARGSEERSVTVLVAGREKIGPAGLIRSHERLAAEFDVRYLDCEGGAMTLESLRAAGILDEIFVTVTDVHVEPSEHAAVKGIVSFGAEAGRLIAEGRTAADGGYLFRRWRVNER